MPIVRNYMEEKMRKKWHNHVCDSVCYVKINKSNAMRLYYLVSSKTTFPSGPNLLFTAITCPGSTDVCATGAGVCAGKETSRAVPLDNFRASFFSTVEGIRLVVLLVDWQVVSRLLKVLLHYLEQRAKSYKRLY